MLTTVEERRASFRALHETGFFVLPNAWDAGGARRLEALGFKAVATSGAGAAWSAGRADGGLGRDRILACISDIVAATALPVNADFENGFADSPADLAHNVAAAVQTGIASLSIEDWSGTDLYDPALGAERIAAAREAIDAVDPAVMLVGRAEFYRAPALPAADWVARAVRYADSGADCLFVPFLFDAGAVRELVAAVAPKPVSVLVDRFDQIPGFAALGVRRCSVGAALAVAAWNAFDDAAAQLRTLDDAA